MMLHLDWVDYAERLLGPADWTDAASSAALFGRAQALLPSDLVLLPVARMATAQLAGRAALRNLVAAKPQGAQPLRTLLADAAFRAIVAEVLTRLAAGIGRGMPGLQLPTPAALAAAVALAAGLAAPAVDEDFADDAAVYVADWLRAFAAAPVAVLLLEDGDHPEFDAPIIRVATHYDWVVLRPAGITSVVVPPDMQPEHALALVAGLRATAEGIA